MTLEKHTLAAMLHPYLDPVVLVSNICPHIMLGFAVMIVLNGGVYLLNLQILLKKLNAPGMTSSISCLIILIVLVMQK